ncbi:hypothetical protein [Allorhodopirellula heiligendammensis]|uniref:Secreted protein n=1 Tax=Allorhodopirellula heiligendammensis TaxID=2714739 RepID=A0A5C6BZV2_9BACT|nr:hypothetical protein [Allorhodopirellula heiligendammensis]TWU16464.1 hypothetical protein Poly21_36690 [Allorhodopirellula heiligendammensis]|tara:strand:+ start:462 stop:635 length:174 start_codon:yes stop_codon:yes gene_type:complete
MKYVLSVLLLSSMFAMTGCGSEATSNVAEDADAQAIKDYEAQMAQSEKEMNEAEGAK